MTKRRQSLSDGRLFHHLFPPFVFLVLKVLIVALPGTVCALSVPSVPPSAAFFAALDPNPGNGLNVDRRKRVAVVGGGISGLVVAYVLQSSERSDVALYEKEGRLGGNIRGMLDPRCDGRDRVVATTLNVGHATHLGMFANLRLLLRHLGVNERPVGRGRNDVPGLFRMLSVSCGNGEGNSGGVVQPPVKTVTSPSIWAEAFVFYFRSYLDPEVRLDDHLRRHAYSDGFLDVLHWSMATFEFDKTRRECGELALGAARALLITQVFFKYLLCDAFGGRLPTKIDDGLRVDLKRRLRSDCTEGGGLSGEAKAIAQVLDEEVSLASYFTADYGELVDKLAEGVGDVCVGSEVRRVKKSRESGQGIVLETKDGVSTFDSVVLTLQPPLIADILDEEDFGDHISALRSIDMGAVGVKIVHAADLPFTYPPSNDAGQIPFDSNHPEPILGIFDISQLTTYTCEIEQKGAAKDESRAPPLEGAGWLSIAYPVYCDDSPNRHQSFLDGIPHLDESVYPWTKATSSFPAIRRRLTDLQGVGGVYVAGHSLTGINKASELQITNALGLCRWYFDAAPPWVFVGDSGGGKEAPFLVPMLPDCNDDDAFRRATSWWEAARWAWKNLLGSFLLVSAVSALGAVTFE